MSEHLLQVSMIRWANLQATTIPQLALWYAIPNGGQRNKVVASKLKAEGAKAGVPDLHLPVARGGCHSLYVETKLPGNKPTYNQRTWHTYLRAEGNRVEMVTSLDQWIELNLDYLEGVK
ncbi:MAG: VRR-NUC domain-containing protein [Opitutales bacterium]|nr:VRR-NUC domain-containing protein [Opitutales bacterium]